MEGGGWRVENGGWRVENGGWRVEGGGRKSGSAGTQSGSDQKILVLMSFCPGAYTDGVISPYHTFI